MDEGRRRRNLLPSSHVIKCNNLVIIIKEERGRNSDAPLKSHLKSVNVKYHSGVGGDGRRLRRQRTLLYQFLHRSSSPFSSPLSFPV